jgi:hypothetical protein
MGTMEYVVDASYQVSGIVKLNFQEPGIRGRPRRHYFLVLVLSQFGPGNRLNNQPRRLAHSFK